MFDIFFKPFAWLLLQLYNLFGNFGVAIIFFAILANLIMLPLHIKGKKSMMRTTRLQPKLQAIQKQYANDRQKQTELMQKLYQEEGINPMGGCGWSLLPFPIFLILYAVLREPLTHLMGLTADQIAQVAQLLNFELNASDAYQQITMAQMIHENFASLSQQLPGLVDINFMFFGINLSEIPNWQFWIHPSWSLIIPILSGAAAWGQQVIMQKSNPQTADAAQAGSMNMMMKIMPLMSVWFAFIMPASMGVYWIINSVIAAGREVLLNRYFKKKFDEEDALKEAAAQRRREQEKAERAERIARQQEIAAQQRTAAGRPKSKKKKPSQKKSASQADSGSAPEDSGTEQPHEASDGDWKF